MTDIEPNSENNTESKQEQGFSFFLLQKFGFATQSAQIDE